ncbi:MAG: alpha-1,2-fucosyltransferase [Chlamydiia bacterium]|nr:alpha-1,2-fucosyltransferase [Chlamydiia bacterium]
MSRLLFTAIFALGILTAERPYVTADLFCQLGNQMFQIAAATALALDHDADALFPALREQERYGMPKNREWVFFRLDDSPLPSKPRKIYREQRHNFSPIPFVPNLKVHGYFQSEKYFRSQREAILSLFQPHPELIAKVEQAYGDILAHPCSVAIHVRTYNAEDPSHDTFFEAKRSYLEAAVRLFPKEALFIVCSDDIPWCKQNLQGLAKNMRFIEGGEYLTDFWLISSCRHQIITSSTFSWWAAYLNPNPEKIVVAPRRWLRPRLNKDDRGIIPEGWVVLDNG